MLLSDDKKSHLSHVVLDCLKQSPEVQLIGDETHALREIKRVITAEVAVEEEIERIARAKLASYSRPIPEGSQEWEVLYRKVYEEELRKRRL